MLTLLFSVLSSITIHWCKVMGLPRSLFWSQRKSRVIWQHTGEYCKWWRGVYTHPGAYLRKMCFVFNCVNYPAKRPDLGYHRVPADSALRQQWINAIKWDDWKPWNYTVVCCKHFTIDSFWWPLGLDKIPSYSKGLYLTLSNLIKNISNHQQ